MKAFQVQKPLACHRAPVSKNLKSNIGYSRTFFSQMSRTIKIMTDYSYRLQRLESANQTFMTDLRRICKVLNGGPEISRILPALPTTFQLIKKYEARSGTVNWKNLESWIKKAEIDLRKEWEGKEALLDIIGLDWSEIGNMKSAKERNELFQARLETLSVTLYGPNWRDAVIRPVKLVEEAQIIDRQKFEWLLSQRRTKVVVSWTALRNAKTKGDLVLFRTTWDRSSVSTRKEWLRARYPELPKRPFAEVYAWTHKQGSPIPRSLFTSALLDIESLSEDGVLPRFLETRATLHPGLFRVGDDRAVFLGIWTGCLRYIQVPDMVLKFMDDDEYSICFEERKATSSFAMLSDSTEAIPAEGFYQLEAQERIYTFLVNCLQDWLAGESHAYQSSGNHNGRDECAATPLSESANGDDYLPLFVRSLRLTYYGDPKVVNLSFLRTLMESSLDEAQEDLWILRDDATTWIHRLEQRPITADGRAANVLRTVLARIDTFHTLRHHLNDYEARQKNESALSSANDGQAWPALANLSKAFESMLNEILGQVGKMSWSPGKEMSSTFTRLFDLIKANDPVVWIMGLPAVLRTIESEAEGEIGRILPFALMQLLHDMSIISACLQETARYYSSLYHPKEIFLTAKLDEEWKKQERPWKLVMEDALDTLRGPEWNKLRFEVLDGTVEPGIRHHKFWFAVDSCMKRSSGHAGPTKSVVDEILRTAPIGTRPTSTDHTIPCWSDTTGPDQATDTGLNKSRRRTPLHAEEVQAPSPLKEQRPVNLPIVRPTKNLDFWNALLALSSENGTVLQWSDFCAAMQNIGYLVIPSGGSYHRFEFVREDAEKLGTILFHKPHQHGSKITRQNARKWWLRRLRSRFTLEL